MVKTRLYIFKVLSFAIFVLGTIPFGGQTEFRLIASEQEPSADETTELLLAPKPESQSEPEPQSVPEPNTNTIEKSENPSGSAPPDNMALPQSFDEIASETPPSPEKQSPEKQQPEKQQPEKQSPKQIQTTQEADPQPSTPKEATVAETVSTVFRPNIIILTADDLGVGDVSCYYAQDIKTPNIDQIARNGLRLGWFCTPISDDQAAQRAILTGTRFSKQIENHNLGFVARQNGYRSCFLGQWLLKATDNQLPLTVGFDSFWGIAVSPDKSPFHPIAGNSLPVQKLYENETVVGYNPNLARFTDELADRAIRFIGDCQAKSRTQRDSNSGSNPDSIKAQPFFLHVAFTAPHVPLLLDSPSTFVEKPEEKAEEISKEKPEEKPEQTTGKETNKNTIEEKRDEPPRGLYGQVVEQLDAAVGRILAALNETGLTDQTFVVFLSDNGPWLSYGSHAGSPGPLREGKGTCWEGGVRVPCVLQWPAVIPLKSDYNHFTTTLDLSLAIAQLLSGQPIPAKGQPANENASPESLSKPQLYSRAEGVSLLPVLTGQYSAALDSRPFVYYLPSGEVGAVRVGNWKIVRPHAYPAWNPDNANPNPGLPGSYRIEKTGWEVYSLKSAASSETQNEAEGQAKLVEAVRKALKE